MATNLSSRLEKLEAEARIKDKPYPKVARLIAKEGEEAEAYRQAEDMGWDLGPEGNDLLIIRLIAKPADRSPAGHPQEFWQYVAIGAG